LIALGSQAELQTQGKLAPRLGYIAEADAEVFFRKVIRAGQLLGGLRRYLSTS
jgi:hypothetical protein